MLTMCVSYARTVLYDYILSHFVYFLKYKWSIKGIYFFIYDICGKALDVLIVFVVFIDYYIFLCYTLCEYGKCKKQRDISLSKISLVELAMGFEPTTC